MSPNSPRSRQLSGSRTRVHRNLFADDQAIGHKFADCLARVGIGDFVDFIGIKPDLAFPAAHHRGSEPLLGAEIDPG